MNPAGHTPTAEPLTAARLSAPSDQMMQHMLAPRLQRERLHLAEHLQVDMAHTVMLGDQQILTRQQCGQILTVLQEADALGADFEVDPRFDSLLLQVEKFLIDRLGEDVGGRMHTGRSRIDHNAAVARLKARNDLIASHACAVAFAAALLDKAREHADTVMPGWTHLQHAQPWYFGHYLLRQCYVFERHLQRLEEAFSRTNLSSLGGAALVGTSWPLDRERVAGLLGHDGLVLNANDAGEFTLDWISEVMSVLAMLMVDLGRLAGDLYLWHSWEFGLIDIADGYCGSSTIMPQKKNAVVLESVRGSAGRAVGWFGSALAVARSASSTDCDPAYVGSEVATAASTTRSSLELMTGIIDTLGVFEDAMQQQAGAHWSTASGLADAIVSENGVSFRTAHKIVARLVRNAVDEEVSPGDVTAESLAQAARQVGQDKLDVSTSWIQQQLEPGRFLESRVTAGGTGSAQMQAQFTDITARLQQRQRWQSETGARVDAARQTLADAMANYVDKE